MNETDVAELIALVKLRYPHAKLGQESAEPEKALAGMVRVWHMALSDVPRDAAERALERWFKTEKWAPDPSEIRTAAAGELMALPEVEEAWAIAQGAIATYYPGHRNRCAMPNVVRQAVNAIGGLHNLKMSEEPRKDRDAFFRVYPIYRKRALESTVLDAPAIDRGAHLQIVGGV